ncbi:hypothetical protein T01_7094 [Trichinella spiralis]|uniref:Uncharacterized protein n=1 Tax=Trichinella spiralis TaxID=6334 RepID=A0A0V1AQA9_TRISP|nr:hypothetical protein T01_7094 [Trichinella spiralis]
MTHGFIDFNINVVSFGFMLTLQHILVGKKIKLTLPYETIFPGCPECILTILQRCVWKYGQDFVDFNLIPYGNAR